MESVKHRQKCWNGIDWLNAKHVITTASATITKAIRTPSDAVAFCPQLLTIAWPWHDHTCHFLWSFRTYIYSHQESFYQFQVLIILRQDFGQALVKDTKRTQRLLSNNHLLVLLSMMVNDLVGAKRDVTPRLNAPNFIGLWTWHIFIPLSRHCSGVKSLCSRDAVLSVTTKLAYVSQTISQRHILFLMISIAPRNYWSLVISLLACPYAPPYMLRP